MTVEILSIICLSRGVEKLQFENRVNFTSTRESRAKIKTRQQRYAPTSLELCKKLDNKLKVRKEIGKRFESRSVAPNCRRRRNEDEAMSKGRGSVTVNGVKSRQHCTIVLESSPSAEIASYDYEAALCPPEVEESQIRLNEAIANTIEDSPREIKLTTPRDLGKESIPKTVCFSTDNQIGEKINSLTELAVENVSQQKIIQQECAACKNIVDESGDEGRTVDGSVADSKVRLSAKELPKSPVLLERSAHGEKTDNSSPKVRTSWKDLTKRKIVDSSVLNDKNNSKIPRATTTIIAAARVWQSTRISSRGNSRTSLATRSFSTTQSKPEHSSCITGSKQASVTRTCDVLERTKGRTLSIVNTKPKKSKASRTSLRRVECANEKTDSQSGEEYAKSRVGNAGDHPSPSPTTPTLKNLRLNNACRSCNDQRETVNLELSIHDVQDPWSDSKSSPAIRTPDRWSKSPKINPYVESTSEEVDLSSEYSSDSMGPKKKKCFPEKSSLRNPITKTGFTGNSPRLRPRRRARFSFLNTLFDIVFWPFLFLRTNR